MNCSDTLPGSSCGRCGEMATTYSFRRSCLSLKRGTIDVLLSRLVSRRRVLLEKGLAVVLACIPIVLVWWGIAVGGAAISASGLPPALSLFRYGSAIRSATA